MNRRDTILIAVLLNAGLLIVLFATSLKSDKKDDAATDVQVISTSQPEVQSASVAAIPAGAPKPDEVDQVIKQFVTPQVSGQVSGQVAGEAQQQPNFLADLNAIGTGPTPATASEAQPAIPEPTSEVTYKEVKVKKGDVLERIARQNHVSVDDIMKANKMATSRLKIGQTLKIPAKAARGLTPTSPDAQYYVVKNGDNPWTIAVKHHIKVEELLKLNDMDETKAKRLKAGDRIRIR